MSSGVTVHSECQQAFQKMAEGKKEFRYIIFKIQDKDVVVDKAVSRDEIDVTVDDYVDNSKEVYNKFVEDVKSVTDNLSGCRYAVFDFKLTIQRRGAGESKMDKIIFLQVCPDGAPIKQKMVYASSASAIKTALGTGKIIPLQISEESEMSHKTVMDKLQDKYRD